MVERGIGNYSSPFKLFRGFNQGGTLSLKMFNILVNTVVRNWIIIVAEEASGPELFDFTVQQMATFFYTDKGLLFLTQM